MSIFNKAKRNIAGATAVRVISMLIGIVSVPMLLKLLGSEQYGVWVSLTALMAFINMLDLGVGNSLRNSVASIVDDGSAESARQEFLAFFQLLCGLALLVIFVLAVAIPAFSLLRENKSAVVLLYGPLLLLFPLLLGCSVLQGAGQVGLQSLMQSMGGWLFFAFIVFCYWIGWSPDLADLALAWSSFTAVTLVAIFWLALQIMRVPVKLLVKNKVRGVLPRLKIGISFLLLQLSAVVLYSIGNAIVYNGLGAVDAARYDVLNKIYQVGLGFYSILIGVMWSEISKFKALSDLTALRQIYRKMWLIALMFCSGTLLIAVFTPGIVAIWTNNQLWVVWQEALAAAVLASFQAFAYVGAVFMNAFEKLREQMAMAFFSVILMLPITNLLMNEGFGIAAVPVAAAMLTILPMVVCNLKALRLINSKSVLIR